MVTGLVFVGEHARVAEPKKKRKSQIQRQPQLATHVEGDATLKGFVSYFARAPQGASSVTPSCPIEATSPVA